MQKTSIKAERIWYLDILRIVATFAVVMIHTNPVEFTAETMNGARYWIGSMLVCVCRFGVPVFFMISGALFLSSEKALSTERLYKKTILRMAVSYFFWSGIYACSYCIHMNRGKWAFLNEIFRGHYHLWFVFVITGLYILTPLIRQIIKNTKMMNYLLMLCLFCGFLIPRLLDFILLFEFPHKDVIESFRGMTAQVNPLSECYAVFYFVMGHYLHTNPPTRSMRRIIAVGGVVGYLMTVSLGAMHLFIIGEFSSYFFDSRAIGVMMMGIAVFVWFGHWFSSCWPSEMGKRFICKLSACSYGVYVVHPLLLEHIRLVYPLTPFGWVVDMLVYTLMIYVISHAVSAILHLIPVVRDWIV